MLPFPIYPDLHCPETTLIIHEISTIYSIQPLSDPTTPPWIVETVSSEVRDNILQHLPLIVMFRVDGCINRVLSNVVNLSDFKAG
ncbi:hypothetical protein Tsubulata_033856, partial [Turnera subulata]